mmetsp:Transcript_4148/g.11856  ORF Transcript_4148/g.11856 Transcript_4148/m.11856 type:complete len:702 (-) Transcript_4148:308-2413(-)
MSSHEANLRAGNASHHGMDQVRHRDTRAFSAEAKHGDNDAGFDVEYARSRMDQVDGHHHDDDDETRQEKKQRKSWRNLLRTYLVSQNALSIICSAVCRRISHSCSIWCGGPAMATTKVLARVARKFTTIQVPIGAVAILLIAAVTLTAALHSPYLFWGRIQPAEFGHTVFDEVDDVLVGRSCLLQRHPVLFWEHRWVCKDCGNGGGAGDSGVTVVAKDASASPSSQILASWHGCATLRPVGKCAPHPFQQLDAPYPRSSSTNDPVSSTPYSIRKITTFGVGQTHRVEYIQPNCRLAGPCFNISRCTEATSSSSPHNTTSHRKDQNQQQQLEISVYAYKGIATQDFVSAFTKYHNGMPSHQYRIVANPADACLLIVHLDDVHYAKQQPSWDGGANHLVYSVTGEHDVKLDKSFGEEHLGMAMVASSTGTVADVRVGYDIPLPLAAQWKPSSRINRDEPPQPMRHRSILLSFKGSIQDSIQPYYQDRWLAAGYWQRPDMCDGIEQTTRSDGRHRCRGNDNTTAATLAKHVTSEVEIDVQCKRKLIGGSRIVVSPYRNTTKQHFADLLETSMFVFCPGGSGIGSYRFVEALSVGAIPVVLNDLPMPFSPEIDWEACVVRVSRARIIDLPRIVGSIPLHDVQMKQDRCWELYRTTISDGGVDPMSGNGDQNSNGNGNAKVLMTMLKVLKFRIRQALERHSENFLS